MSELCLLQFRGIQAEEIILSVRWEEADEVEVQLQLNCLGSGESQHGLLSPSNKYVTRGADYRSHAQDNVLLIIGIRLQSFLF
jgi:hypothetical protein